MADSTAREIAERLRALHADMITTHGWHRQELLEAADLIAALADAEARVRQAETKRDEVRELLALAAMEINCVGPVHERIRVLKREHSARLAAVEQALRKFARHDDFCDAEAWEHRNRVYKPNYPRPNCTCGLSAALGDPQ